MPLNGSSGVFGNLALHKKFIQIIFSRRTAFVRHVEIEELLENPENVIGILFINSIHISYLG